MTLRSLQTLFLACLLSLLTGCEQEFVPDDGLDYSDIAKHHVYDVYTKTQHLRKVSPDGSVDFVFITDTHYSDNSLYSPSILAFLVSNGFTNRVFWGGDAITAYGDIESEWRAHQQLFLGKVRPMGRYYMVKGNHEFTSKNKNTGRGVTYDAARSGQLFWQQPERDIVRPIDDPTACYYYVDDAEHRLRYCVFDTTDSISSADAPWGTVTHTSLQQLDWMDRHALHGVPAGYGLVVFTHIGVIEETFGKHGPLDALHDLLLHADAPILMVLSGHMHQDFQTYDHGVLHVLTGSDAAYPEYANSPFLHNLKRSRYHDSAQLLDCITLSPDRRIIDMVRIGAGYNRTFHLDTLQLSLSASKATQAQPIRFAPDEVSNWTCYDAKGYACVDDSWQPPCTIVTTTEAGLLHPQQPGDAVLMATSKKGHKEFFHIRVIP